MLCKFSLRKGCPGVLLKEEDSLVDFLKMDVKLFEVGPEGMKKYMELPETGQYFPVWQSLFWNTFLLRSGWEKRGFFVSSDITGFFELRSIGLGLSGLFCVGGPVVIKSGTSAKNPNAIIFSRVLKDLAQKLGAVFVQIEPINEWEIPGFKKGEYRHFLEKRTLLLDISGTEDEILSQMKEKGRYNIRLAEKRGITVRIAEPTEKNVAEFTRILHETLIRDGFSGNSFQYYLALVQALHENKTGGLFFAEKNGEVLAAAIASFYKGTAVYYYGASTSDNEKRRDMPAYALQWSMILEAKHRGCIIYDFLGIAPSDSPRHPLAGVTDFKLKFGGEIKQWPESRIMVVRP